MVEEDGGGWGGGRQRTEEGGVEKVFWRPWSTNGEMEVERKGGTMSSGRACLKCEEIYKISPVSNFPHHSNISRLGIGQ